MNTRLIKKYIIFFAVCIGILFAGSGGIEASVYSRYKPQIDKLAKGIQREINLGGTELFKSVTVTKSDQKEWEAAEKRLRAGKYGVRYDYWFKRSFRTPTAAYGFLDTVVGKKYRYLELRHFAASSYKPYYLCVEATKRNKYTLDYYIRNQKSMLSKLNKLFNSEIKAYKKKSTSAKIAIAASVVDNYFSYKELPYSGNLAYSLNRKKGVCSDYSFMMDYFLRKLGFTTRIVSIHERFGYDEEYGAHAINAVKINKEWFYVDTTNMDQGQYGVMISGDNYWFTSDLDLMTFPGWEARCAY